MVTTIEDEYLITSFVVPSKYYGDIPKPTNENVFIEKVEKGLFIAIRFSGKWTKDNFDKHDKILKEYMNKYHIEAISKGYILRYQAPIVPSILRRNEILYRIKK